MPNIELKRPDPNAAAAPGHVRVDRPNSAAVASSVINGLMETIKEQGGAKYRFGQSLQGLGAAVAKFGGTIGGLKGAEAQHIMREATKIDAISYSLECADAMRRAQEQLKKDGPFNSPEAAAEKLDQYYTKEMVPVNARYFNSEANTRAPGQYFRYAKEMGLTPNSLYIQNINGDVKENAGRQILMQWAQEQDAVNMSIQKIGITKGISENITDKDYYKNILSSGYLSESALDAAADSCVHDAIQHKIGTSVADYRQNISENYAANVTANEVRSQASRLSGTADAGKQITAAKENLSEAQKALDSARLLAATEYMQTGEVSKDTAGDLDAKQKAYDDAEQKLFDAKDALTDAAFAMLLLPESLQQECAIEQTNKDALEGMRKLFHTEEAEKWRNDPRFPQSKQWADQTEAQALADVANNIELSEGAYTKSLWDNFIKARQDGTSPVQWNTELVAASAALGSEMTPRELRDFINELRDLDIELQLTASGAKNMEDVPVTDLTKGIYVYPDDTVVRLSTKNKDGNIIMWEGTRDDLYNDAVATIGTIDFSKKESRSQLLYTLKAAHLLNPEQQKAIGEMALEAVRKPKAKYHGEKHIQEDIMSVMAEKGMIRKNYMNVNNAWSTCIPPKHKEFAQSLFRMLQDTGKPTNSRSFIDSMLNLYNNGQIQEATADAVAARTLGLVGLQNTRVIDEERVADRIEWFKEQAEKARNEERRLRRNRLLPATSAELDRVSAMSDEEYNKAYAAQKAKLDKTIAGWTPMHEVRAAGKELGYLDVNSGLSLILNNAYQVKTYYSQLKDAQRRLAEEQEEIVAKQQEATKNKEKAETYGR